MSTVPLERKHVLSITSAHHKTTYLVDMRLEDPIAVLEFKSTDNDKEVAGTKYSH